MTVDIDFDLSAGQYVKGIRLSDTCFIAATTFQQLRTITRDPDVLQPGSKRGNDDPSIEAERTMHELIQRALAGNKKSNVPKYANYIEQLVRGEIPGVLPPMHLWSASPLQTVVVGPTTYALVPNGEHLLAIDGETQLTAHHALGRSVAIDDKTRAEHRVFPLIGILHHGITPRDARQYFHDLNILAVKPNASLGLSMDTQDPIMQVVTEVETNIHLLSGNVEKMSRQLSKASTKVMTLQSLRQMVVNIAKGISGVQYGARPVPVSEIDLRQLTAVATEWIGAYLDTFRNEVLDRETYLASSGPVLAAIGGIGNTLLRMDSDERARNSQRLLQDLSRVDWRKGEHWIGIAGNITPSGVFSVKGTKEVAYAVYNALADPSSSGYHQVHIPTPPPATDLQPRQNTLLYGER